MSDPIDNAEQSARLKTLRLKAGQDPEGLADQIGISAAWYADLESEPGELETGLDLSQLRKLALLLNVGAGYLVLGAPIPESVPMLSFLELARRIRLEYGTPGELEQLEEKTGWDLAGFLKHPEADGWEFPLPFYRDVSGELGLDWRGVLKFCDSIREEE